jgi:hypothetical protein
MLLVMGVITVQAEYGAGRGRRRRERRGREAEICSKGTVTLGTLSDVPIFCVTIFGK